MSFKSWSEDQKKKPAASVDGKAAPQVTAPGQTVVTNKGASPAEPIKKA